MKNNFFLDTNIFIYSFDHNNKRKQEKSKELILKALETGKGKISYQVIQELINVAIRKFEIPLSLRDCEEYLDNVLEPLCYIHSSKQLYKKALDINKETGYSFYDSLIVASAIIGNCGILYSEDLQNGRRIDSVKIINPFTENYTHILE